MEEVQKNRMKNNFIIGIDASRNRSGGAKAHIIGLINSFINLNYNNIQLHIWSYESLLKLLPDSNQIIKHNPKSLQKNIFRQIWWQFFYLPRHAKSLNCDILLYTDAGAIINFEPCVVMSRDMLSYEKGEMNRYGFSLSKIRLILLKYLQAKSLRNSNGSIFLTKYASDIIQEFTGELINFKIIPHGVGEKFRRKNEIKIKNFSIKNIEINCIYISNAALYKHQWNVIKAIKNLRNKGFNIKLKLIGGGSGLAQEKIDNQIKISDPNKNYVSQLTFLDHKELPQHIFNSDIFIFASSCENMPNTLLEGMASGIPIACSNRGPMPEVLKNAGFYFNPEDVTSIENSLIQLFSNSKIVKQKCELAVQYSKFYSWERCTYETIEYLKFIFEKYNNSKI